jgi:SAM-dependent methyltransferase
MALPAVGQSRLIADQLQSLVASHAPRSVAILGCAGGNGFECLIDTNVTRVVGVDINPRYIEEARQRYAGRMPGLELLVADIQTSERLFEPVELIYAALVLEYVDVERTVSILHRHCTPGGVLAVLSQAAHESLPEVSPSPYGSLQSLEPAMRLVPPGEVQLSAERTGFAPEISSELLSPGGKRFVLETFRAVPAQASRKG